MLSLLDLTPKLYSINLMHILGRILVVDILSLISIMLYSLLELSRYLFRSLVGKLWYSLNSPKTRKLFLPVDTKHLPDWEFMEAMRQVRGQAFIRSSPKLEAQLLEHIISLGALEDENGGVLSY